MIGLFIYCVGIWFGIILASFIIGALDRVDNRWQNKITAEDLRELGRLFDQEKI